MPDGIEEIQTEWPSIQSLVGAIASFPRMSLLEEGLIVSPVDRAYPLQDRDNGGSERHFPAVWLI